VRETGRGVCLPFGKMFAADPLEGAIQARYARWICAAGSGENVKLCLYLLLGTGSPARHVRPGDQPQGSQYDAREGIEVLGFASEARQQKSRGRENPAGSFRRTYAFDPLVVYDESRQMFHTFSRIFYATSNSFLRSGGGTALMRWSTASNIASKVQVRMCSWSQP
jgi:hypothetical protein